MPTDTPTKHWSLETALEQLESCEFECIAGPLAMNDAFVWLKGILNIGPEFWPGQGVWFQITAEAAGKSLTQWVHFFIVGCQMKSGTDERYWTYWLSYDPPAPYHYGEIHFSNIRGDRLRLEKPDESVENQP